MVYMTLLFSILLIGIVTATIAPLWQTLMQREREAELLFRLGEFRRAIERYRADRGRYPKELKDLLEDRSQLQTRRYLRRIYRDPVTGKDDWKLELIADRAGIVSGIKDLHSRSEARPLKVIKEKQERYSDW